MAVAELATSLVAADPVGRVLEDVGDVLAGVDGFLELLVKNR